MSDIGVSANSRQLVRAIELIREAGPTIANGIRAERPAWLSNDEESGDLLVVDIGILPSEKHKISRDGHRVID